MAENAVYYTLHQPVHLAKAFEKGCMRSITLINTNKARPPTGKHWLFLFGTAYFKTGTNMAVWVRRTDKWGNLDTTYNNMYVIFKRKDASADAFIDIPYMEDAAQLTPLPPFLILDDTMDVYMVGSVNSSCSMTFLEW